MKRRTCIRTFTFTQTLRAKGWSASAELVDNYVESTERSCFYQLRLSVNPGTAYCMCVGCFDEESGYSDYRNHLSGCPRHRPTKRLGIKWSHAKDCHRCKADIQAQIPIELTVNNVYKAFDDPTIELIRDMLDCSKPMIECMDVIQGRVT